MVTFYCPACWKDFPEDRETCPHCGVHIGKFLADKDFIDKLILSLDHPEKSAPIRAAWLLGQLRDRRAVRPLINVIGRQRDIYLVQAAICALAEIGGPEARDFLKTLTQHPARLIHLQAGRALRNSSGV